MDSIIVTVTDALKCYSYDIEVPTNVSADRLKRDIVEALNGYNSYLLLKADFIELYCDRLGRNLEVDETFESAGVWNGDYITLIEV